MLWQFLFLIPYILNINQSTAAAAAETEAYVKLLERIS